MSRICKTALKRYILIGLAVTLVFSVAVVAFIYMIRVEPDYFEEHPSLGTPAGIAEEYGYSAYSATGICDLAICGNPQIIEKTVKLYLTNPATNTVAIKAEIYTPKLVTHSDGQTEVVPDECLGGTKFIRPGEYVESLELDHKLKEESTNVMIKISTLDEVTGLSNGFFYINTTLNR